MQQENVKLLFYTKYKYLFTLDPSNRLKLRDENKQDDNEEQVYGYLEDEEKEEEKLKKMRMNQKTKKEKKIQI